MEAPETTFVRRKEIFQWLGINWSDLDKCVKAGLIHPVMLPGAKYKKYLTKEINRVFTPVFAQGATPGKKGVSHETMVRTKVKNRKKRKS